MTVYIGGSMQVTELDIGEKIQQLRAQHAVKRGIKNYTQRDLADDLGMRERNSIGNWERGGDVPPLQRLKMAELFGCDPSFLGLEGVMVIPPNGFEELRRMHEETMAALREIRNAAGGNV